MSTNQTTKTALRRLGSSDLRVSPIGLGCWQFSGGQGGLAGRYWPALDPSTELEIVRESLAGGITWFDTAEAYGGGNSERALAWTLHTLEQRPGSVVVATKWRPFFRTARSLLTSIDARQQSLGGYPIDLYQIHAPMSLSSVPAQMRALASLLREGKVRQVGVSNFSASQMRRAQAALREEGYALVSNQVRFNLLDRRIEDNGVLEAARELGMSVIAYSPLAQGLLTGKFHENPGLLEKLTGPRKWMGSINRKRLEETAGLVEELRRIAAAHEVTPAEAALNWVIRVHGESIVAIPGASKPSQARLNARAQSFALSDEEVHRLSDASRRAG
jgi:aryl-alcohol dehydrogenase-like predicted oxidoreductase